MKTRTAHDNADEFGATERGEGGWNQAVLAACSVGTGPGQVNIKVFADWAQVTVKTVSNYIEAWDLAVSRGVEIPARAELSPERVGTFPLPARSFNGPGGFVKTRTGGANSTDAIIDKVKTKTGSYAGRIANDPAALAALLETASPESLKQALGAVDNATLRSVARRAGDEQFNQIQGEIVCGGGRIPSLEEINGGTGSELDATATRLSQWAEVANALDAAIAKADDYGLVGADGFEAGFLRDRAMKLMDLIVSFPADVEVQS